MPSRLSLPRTFPAVRGSAVPGAAHDSVPVGMASASLLPPSLRRRGLRTVRHGPETAGRASFPDGTRNGSSPSSVRPGVCFWHSCAVLRATSSSMRTSPSAMPFTDSSSRNHGLSSCRTAVFSSTIWAIGCRLPARCPSALLHTLPGCWRDGLSWGWNWRF